MSNVANDTDQTVDAAARARRRQYRITARVLKEYTVRLHRIIRLIGEYADGRIPRTVTDTMPWEVAVSVQRVGAIKQQVRDLAVYASQMLVHYGFDEAESAELGLRLADAEHAAMCAEFIADSITGISSPRPRGSEDPGVRFANLRANGRRIGAGG